MKLLLLGGTRDAKMLAHQLHQQGISVIYSIAGLVRQAELPCEVISGGFRQYGGLTQYIQANNISALLDATHPFAQAMSQQAIKAAHNTGIPYWQYQRPAWQATPKDHWTHCQSWPQLLEHLAVYQRIFLSQGQLSKSMLETLLQQRSPTQSFLHRTAISPKHANYPWLSNLQDIGPFSLDDELALLKKNRIEVIVSKNSGGDLPAKMLAARVLQLPVLLLEMPAAVSLHTYHSITEVIEAVHQA